MTMLRMPVLAGRVGGVPEQGETLPTAAASKPCGVAPATATIQRATRHSSAPIPVFTAFDLGGILMTFRARRTRPSRPAEAEPLESRRMLAVTPDLLLVGYDRSISKPVIWEYTRAGALVNTVVVEQPPAPYPTTPLDVAAAPDGKWQVFNGSTWSSGAIAPSLSTYDPVPRTWAHHTAPGWTAPYFQDDGGVAVAGQYVFVSDRMNDAGEPSGLIRFDTANGYAPQRFADGATYGDVTLGLDGLLYAVGTPTSSASGSAIRVFDPRTLEPVRATGLPY